MKNTNKISGEKHTISIIQTEKGDINITNSMYIQPNYTKIQTQKEKELNTGITLNSAKIIAIIALLANFTTLYLNLVQIFSSLNMYWIISFITIPIFIVIVTLTKELKTRRFSTILPGIRIPSQYVFLLNKQNKIVLTKLQMNCPKCNSEMRIAIVKNECYACCERNPSHNMIFDYTTLDNI